jgi:transposase
LRLGVKKGAIKQGVEQDSKRVLRLGLDLHYRQVTVALQEDGGRIKVAGKMSHQVFDEWLRKKLSQGWSIWSCYEAGASGYWLHRELQGLGVTNLVVAPQGMARGAKKQKTDKRDSAQLVDCLDRYLRGQKQALSPVAVPSLEQEQKRALIRYHRQIMADRGRYQARGKSLLCAQGIEVPGKWWQVRGWITLNSDVRCRDWLREQLKDWREKILSAEAQQQILRKRVEALAAALSRPKGMGSYSAALLEYEMKGWARFNNRRQVSSYTGLCPGVHLSDGRGREGAINRCGNRIVRWTLVEMIWRLVKWQPDYQPVRLLARGLIKSSRAKKRLAVRAARCLAIDLRRLQTGQTTAQKLGLLLQQDLASKTPAAHAAGP